MTPPDRDRDDAPATAGSRRWTLAVVGALAVLLVAAAIAGGMAAGRSSASPAAGPPASATPRPGTAGAGATRDPRTGKAVPPAMSTRQYETTRAELTALAARLPARVTLTAPAAWAQYAGQTPSYAEDIVSCPHIADRLAADLGARWTYSSGKLPTGPFGCTWTPVPWVPDVSRFFVSIGYRTGDVPDLLRDTDYCSGGVDAPRVDVPALGRSAVLCGCHDVSSVEYDLAVPDTAGTGVFFLHATSRARQTPAQVADALLALVDGATHAYG